MRFKLLIFILSLSITSSFGQQFNILKNGDQLHRRMGHLLLSTEKSIGIIPEVQLLNPQEIGISISRSNFDWGEYHVRGEGINLGVFYSPLSNFTGIHFTAWHSRNVLGIFGIYGGIRMQYETDFNYGNFVFAPQIGWGGGKVNLYYSRNVFINKNLYTYNRNTITLSWYFAVYPKKKAQI